jgi:hypothetical protein
MAYEQVGVQVIGGLLDRRQIRNSTATIPHATERCGSLSDVDNLECLFVADAPPCSDRSQVTVPKD